MKQRWGCSFRREQQQPGGAADSVPRAPLKELHVFHGVEGRILWDLGDFLDDYAVDPVLRNDLGLLFLVTLDRDGPGRLEAVPLKLEFCFTRLAEGEEARWIAARFREACEAMGTEVREERGRSIVQWQ